MEKPGLNLRLLFLSAGSALHRPFQKAGALGQQVLWKALRSDTTLGLEQTAGGFRAVRTLRERKAVTQPFPSKNNKRVCLPRTSRHSRRETGCPAKQNLLCVWKEYEEWSFSHFTGDQTCGPALSPPKCKLDKAERPRTQLSKET